jgi:argininosuccinate synthase
MGTEKAYSTDANVLGATHEAKDLEHLDKNMIRSSTRSWASRSGSASVEIEAEEVTVGFEQGLPVASTASASPPSSTSSWRQPHRRAARPRHERPDREPGHRGQEPRHLRGPRHGAAAHRVRAPALGHPQREHPRPVLHPRPPLGRLLYEGKWYDPEALMLKDALTRWVAPSITGEVTLELRRGDDYTLLDTRPST